MEGWKGRDGKDTLRPKGQGQELGGQAKAAVEAWRTPYFVLFLSESLRGQEASTSHTR